MKADFRHIIFDLDGTLVDSAPLCAAIVNDMLAERGSPRIVTSIEARKYLTQGGSQLVGALLGPDGGDIAAEVADFRRRYIARDTPPDCPFPGVNDGLARLSGAGLRLAICSNKPQHLCEKTVVDLGWDRHFEIVVGSLGDVPLKPASDLANRALAKLETSAAHCLFVGDSDIDRQTAARTGTPFALMTYGYAEFGLSIDAMARFDHFGGLVSFLGTGGATLSDRNGAA